MAETLGSRIMEAAFRWQFERALNGMEAGRAEYDALAALCARADAAELLAVAVDAYWRTVDVYDASEDAGEWDGLLEAMGRVRVDLDNALAAWRAITEGVQS